MTKIQKILAALLPLLLCISIAILPVCAAENTQDGLILTLTTDQDSYQTGDPITVTLTVTNGNSTTLTGLVLELCGPEGYTLEHTEGLSEVNALPSGETAALTGIFSTENISPPESEASTNPAADPAESTAIQQQETSDSSTGKTANYWWILALVVFAVLGIAVAKKWIPFKKITMLFLCFTLLVGVLPFPANAAQAKELILTHEITVSGTPVTFTARVTYDPVKYTVTVVQGDGSGEYYPGEAVTVEAYTYDEEYLFSGWAGEGITFTDLTAPKTEFIMPAADVTVTAYYYVPKHTVTVTGGSGSGRYTPGDIVTITAESAEGMIFSGWDAPNVNLTDPASPTTDFIMPNGDVEITAKFESEVVIWALPCNYTVFIAPFGPRVDPVSGITQNHNGVDLAAPEGTPIYATRSGTVTFAGYDVTPGNYVLINHGDGYQSIYMHMTYYTVQTGASVTQGQIIGYVGSTGMSTGPHLHFGIRYQGHYLNPANFIPLY